MDKIMISLRLTPELLKRIDNLALSEKRTRTNLIQVILENHFEKGKINISRSQPANSQSES